MWYRDIFLLSCIALATVACDNRAHQSGDEVIAVRCIHKYGYDVPKDEWEAHHYPGKIIATHRNGVTVSTHYEDGLMHGERARTYPHSQTVEMKDLFERGTLVKKTTYDLRGIPSTETHYLSPTHTKTISWYSSGTPKSTEEYVNGNLTTATYYNAANEVESTIENGSGTLTQRDGHGELKSRVVYDNFAIVQKEYFSKNEIPSISEFYKDGLLNGPRLVYSEYGSPISSEQYKDGLLNGACTYYQNGYKYLEIPFLDGQKNGIERHFIDGEELAEETEWHDNIKHGPSVIFYDGVPTTTWYYNNEKVSRMKYEELCRREDEIMRINDRGTIWK
ncbi:MAG: hypothetical protein K9M07_00095 [Simkaniaceae bacterium]|nr:hypothetical protein [Simkaniaceae bacterium]